MRPLSAPSQAFSLSVSVLLPLLAGCAVTLQTTPPNNASGIANPVTVSVTTNTTIANSAGTGAHTLSVTAVLSQPAFYSIPTGTPTQTCSMPGGFFGTVNECAKMTATSTFLVNCSKGTISVTTQFPINVAHGQTVQLTASGGCPPYSWAVSGSLPPGISISPTGLVSGTYSGTCPAEWTFDSSVKVTDAAGGSGSSPLSFNVC